MKKNPVLFLFYYLLISIIGIFILPSQLFAAKPGWLESVNYDAVCNTRGGTCQGLLGCSSSTSYDDSGNDVCHPALQCCTPKHSDGDSCNSPVQCTSGTCQQNVCGGKNSPASTPTPPSTRCERNGYEQYCIKNHGAGSDCVPSNKEGDGCTKPSSNASKACTDRGGMCSVACNPSDFKGPMGEYGCSNSQYCCVPRKISCDEEKFFIEYKCENKQVCFLNVIRNQQTSCLWKETDSLGKAGYHCESKYKCDASCLSKISCFTTREKCIRKAFTDRDICYDNAMKDSNQPSRETCSEDYIANIDACMDAYNDAKCADKVKSCYGNNAAPTQAPAPKPGGGSPSGPTPTKVPLTGGSDEDPNACPAKGDNCTYSEESGVCYSGKGPNSGFNVKGCKYSCGPVSCPEIKKDPKKKYIDCNPGEPLNECSMKCKNGGTCTSAHTFCEWTEAGNIESKCVCDDENTFCKKDDGNNACKDNPTAPPDGYTWKNSCKSCSNNDQCPKNTGDPAVNPDTSNWCFSGQCLKLVSGGSTKQETKKEEKKSSKNKDKDKKKKSSKKDKNDGKTRDDTGNRNKNHGRNDKSARDWAQKPIDKINKDRLRQGLPTLTPLPPDWDPKTANNPQTQAAATPTPSPTPLPPLAEPDNLQAICGPTTNAQKPLGIRVSWHAVQGASRYAVRIDEDAPSWEGDTPSPGDTVDNQVTGTAYTREAKAGAVYQWWVHSVNKDGVYSKLTQKKVVKCPENTTTNKNASRSAGTVGAGELIVLP